MGLNRTIHDVLIAEMSETFNSEATFYTVEGVATTPHAVGKRESKENWTTILSSKKIIQMPKLANLYTELERTMVALYCYLLFNLDVKEAYHDFIAAQKDNLEISKNDILSFESFSEIFAMLKKVLNGDKDKQDILKFLIVYSDLGKSPAVKKAALRIADSKDLKLDPTLDYDGLMATILKKFNDDEIASILPSFKLLSLKAKALLKNIYPIMQACFGHLYFLERGKKTLQIIAEALQDLPSEQQKLALDLVFFAQFFDAAGAQGQRKMLGSVTATESFCTAYQLIYESFIILQRELNKTKNLDHSCQTAFDFYLEKRAALLGFKETPLSAKDEFLTRLCCTLRGVHVSMGEIAAQEFKELTAKDQKLLLEQLSFSENGFESWSVRANYAATIMLNLSREAATSGNTRKAVQQALKAAICFAMLVRKTTEEYPNLVKGPESLSAISFGEIASLATTNPGLFNNPSLLVSQYSFDPKQNKIIKVKSSFSPTLNFSSSFSVSPSAASLDVVLATKLNKSS